MIKPSYYYVHILIGMHNELTQCTFTFISLESLQLSSLHSQTIQICTFPKKKKKLYSLLEVAQRLEHLLLFGGSV